MVWDFAFGKQCDHRVMEELVPVVVNPTTVKFNLTFQMNVSAPGFTLTKNGTDISSTVAFTVNINLDKEVVVTGLVYDTALYPPDDYTLEYYAQADRCPKCFRGIY